MNHGDVALGIVMHELLLTHPAQQFVAIRCFKNFAQCVAFLEQFVLARDGQQVQVMVAEHAHQGLADAVQVTKCLQ